MIIIPLLFFLHWLLRSFVLAAARGGIALFADRQANFGEKSPTNTAAERAWGS